MKTRERLHADMKAILHNEPVPVFPAVIAFLCGYIDDALDTANGAKDSARKAHSKIHRMENKEIA